MSTALGLSLSLPNRTQSCETARDAVLRLLAPYSLDEQVMFNVELMTLLSQCIPM